MFTKRAIAREERLEMSFPAGKYVKVVSPEFKPEVKEEGARRIYWWMHSNLEVKEKDPDEIPRRTPPNPDVQVTTFASWEEVGKWYGALQKTQLEITPSIRAKANELTNGLKSDEEKIHAIYNFVSLKYHYIGLDFGIGRYQPHAADDVLDNGYGDCKDKHTLLAALLKAAGIEAWPALIHSSRRLDPDVPSPAQFNYVRKSYADWDNRQIIAPLPPTGVEVSKDAKEKTPMDPLPLGALGKIVYHSRLELPDGYTVTAPAKVHLTEPYADYDSATTVAGGVMTTNREIVIKQNEVALSEWDGFRKFGRAIYDDEYNFLRLEGSGIGVDSKAAEEDRDMALDEMFREGTSAGQRRDFHSAQDWFQRVIAKDPKYAGAHFGLGSALMMQGQMETALTEFRKEQEISPQDERAYMAMFLEQMGQKDEATAEWRKLLKADPSNQKAAATLGRLLLGSAKYNEAIEVFEAAGKRAPDNAGLQLALGEAYLKTGNKEQAVAQ
jgi:Flp pilus assembly protein TadD